MAIPFVVTGGNPRTRWRYEVHRAAGVHPFQETLRVALELDGVTKDQIAIFLLPCLSPAAFTQAIPKIRKFRRDLTDYDDSATFYGYLGDQTIPQFPWEQPSELVNRLAELRERLDELSDALRMPTPVLPAVSLDEQCRWTQEQLTALTLKKLRDVEAFGLFIAPTLNESAIDWFQYNARRKDIAVVPLELEQFRALLVAWSTDFHPKKPYGLLTAGRQACIEADDTAAWLAKMRELVAKAVHSS